MLASAFPPPGEQADARRDERRLMVQQVCGAIGSTGAVAVAHRFHLLGPAPLWPFLINTVAMTVVSFEGFQRFLAGGDLRRRLWPRVLLHMAVVAPGPYITGWGPLLIGIFMVLAMLHLRWSGSTAWLPATVGAVIAIALAQIGIELGWVYSYLSVGAAHTAAAMQTMIMVLLLHHIGSLVAAREQAEDLVAAKERRFRRIAHNSADLSILTDTDGRMTWVSPSVWHLLGRAPEELIGHRLGTLLDPADRPVTARLGTRLRQAAGAPHRLEWRLQHPDGMVRWYDVMIENFLDDPDVDGILINQRDVTEARLARDRLAHEATHDALTGLLNRAGFMRELHDAIDRHDVDGAPFALLYIDLNSFKPINDTLGHEAGDAVLVAVARALTDSVLGIDVAARLGGDEFAIILTTAQDDRSVTRVAQRLSDRISSPLEIAGQILVPHASVGITISHDRAADAGRLLHEADLAMYHAKRGKLPWVLYTPALEPTT